MRTCWLRKRPSLVVFRAPFFCCAAGAPDLDHTNSHLREALTHWMQHLRDNVGFTGWRFDFAR
jgi:hypothetical protein